MWREGLTGWVVEADDDAGRSRRGIRERGFWRRWRCVSPYLLCSEIILGVAGVVVLMLAPTVPFNTHVRHSALWGMWMYGGERRGLLCKCNFRDPFSNCVAMQTIIISIVIVDNLMLRINRMSSIKVIWEDDCENILAFWLYVAIASQRWWGDDQITQRNHPSRRACFPIPFQQQHHQHPWSPTDYYCFMNSICSFIRSSGHPLLHPFAIIACAEFSRIWSWSDDGLLVSIAGSG